MGGRLSLQMDKASEPCTNSSPNLTSTPKNEEIFLGRELAEEGRAEVRKCGSARGGGVPLSLVHTASSKQFSLQERAKIDTEQKPSRTRSLGLDRGGWL